MTRDRPQELESSYDKVAVLCVYDHPDQSPFIRDSDENKALKRQTCRLGADLLAVDGMCGRWNEGILLGAWRLKP
jgi:hypothetical protein